MAWVQIVSWKDIPLQVRARQADGERVSRSLSLRFQQAADAAAMRGGQASAEAYLDAMKTSDWQERSGDAHLVADEVAAELERHFTEAVLQRLVQAGGVEQ